MGKKPRLSISMKESKRKFTRNLMLFFVISILIAFTDQLLKYIIEVKKQLLPVNVFSFLSISYTTNTGAAFGMMKGMNLLFVFFSIIAAFFLLYFLFRKQIGNDTLSLISSSLFFGGLLGNLIDRIMLGYVVDFIDFSFWPAFNIADIGITIGVFGLLWFTLQQ